jgi:hypothetical protein
MSSFQTPDCGVIVLSCPHSAFLYKSIFDPSTLVASFAAAFLTPTQWSPLMLTQPLLGVLSIFRITQKCKGES